MKTTFLSFYLVWSLISIFTYSYWQASERQSRCSLSWKIFKNLLIIWSAQAVQSAQSAQSAQSVQCQCMVPSVLVTWWTLPGPRPGLLVGCLVQFPVWRLDSCYSPCWAAPPCWSWSPGLSSALPDLHWSFPPRPGCSLPSACPEPAAWKDRSLQS